MIGDRQKVDVIVHPKFGECRCVHENGPSFLVSADGAVTPIAWCGFGWSVDLGSYQQVRGLDGVTVKCPLKFRGDSHYRAWNASFGEGWLVSLGGAVGADDCDPAMRFDGDDGRVVTFSWVKFETIGTEAWRALPKRKRDKAEWTAEDKRWRRYEARDGSALVFRAGGAPPVAAVPVPDTKANSAEQLGLAGVK